MSAVTVVARLRDQVALFWMARTEQERKMLTIGGFTVVGALIYLLFIAPAWDGIKALDKALPELRQDAARLQALGAEASELGAQSAPQVMPMTDASLKASLAARSLTATSLVITGQFAKLQFNGVAFPQLYGWLEAQRREHRIGVQDLGVTAGTAPGQVDATITLQQDTGEMAR